MSVIEYSPEEELLEEAREYEADWSSEIGGENIREDENFLYLELESENDIRDEFMELGNYLEARSTGVVNGGERYVLSVEK